jgi:ElaB/YqjD/DUF883 family membrane-anchored ribosome-binding protein
MQQPQGAEARNTPQRTEGLAEAEQALSRGAEKARRYGEVATQRVEAVYDRGAQAAKQAYRSAVDYNRENPAALTLVALGAGVGIGLLFARRNRHGAWPAAATLVADAFVKALRR